MKLKELIVHDGLFWRRLAHLGASRGPEWLRRYTPPLFGCAASVVVPSARRAVVANLRRIRGDVGAAREALDVVRTFATYAGSLAEALASNGTGTDENPPNAIIFGERHLQNAIATKRGVIFVTAHTGGWEVVGPLLSQHQRLSIVMVMEKERDENARQLQDELRKSRGLRIVHVGEGDPLASLPLLRHLREGGVVALQVDRTPRGIRSRPVTLLGAPGAVPEGPLRLAQLSGAQIVPIFAARLGYRRYAVRAFPPISVARRPTEAELDRAAQHIADPLTTFLRAHPTQWFHFRTE